MTDAHTFMDRSCFAGPSIDVGAFRGSFIGRATFNGCIVVCSWPREDVERILPAELLLAENRSATPHRHPVVFVFGEQTEGATRFAGVTIPLGIRYEEFALAVPFVRHAQGQNLHTYVPRMVASYFPATWNGNAFYGLGKRMGRLGWEGPIFRMTDTEGQLLFHAAVEATGDWSPGGGGALPNFDRMREFFSLPVVGRRENGALVGCYFDWDFRGARVRPTDARVSIDAPFAEGLVCGSSPGAPSGSFEVHRMLWRLSWPGRCRF